MATSMCTQPSTDGPITMPAITSRTAPGTVSAGTKPRITGTSTDTMPTTSTPVKETTTCQPPTGPDRLAGAGRVVAGHHESRPTTITRPGRPILGPAGRRAKPGPGRHTL